jgi:hypothetical protein
VISEGTKNKGQGTSKQATGNKQQVGKPRRGGEAKSRNLSTSLTCSLVHYTKDERKANE